MQRRDMILSALLVPLAGGTWAAPGAQSAEILEIGRVALAEGAVPSEAAALRRSLGLAPGQKIAALPNLAARIAEDFARFETVSVADWYLSRTEAEICALAVLAPEVL